MTLDSVSVGPAPGDSAAVGLAIYDTATLRDGAQPTGEITFALHGPGDPTCSGTALLTTATIVTGNGTYNSGDVLGRTPPTWLGPSRHRQFVATRLAAAAGDGLTPVPRLAPASAR